MRTDPYHDEADRRPCVKTESRWLLKIRGFAFLLVIAAATQSSAAPLLEEASGLLRIGDFLAIVSDKEPGRYYLAPVPATTPGPASIDPARVRTIEWPAASVGLDLEGIAQLADGRVVLLSERLRSLLDDRGNFVSWVDRTGTTFAPRAGAAYGEGSPRCPGPR